MELNTPTPLIRLYFDGGSLGNPGNGYGSYEVVAPDIFLTHKASRLQFGTLLTNNQAEYLACIAGLKWLSHHVHYPEQCRLEIFTDSWLVKTQVQGNCRCKVLHLQELKQEALELLEPYAIWKFFWHGRKNNVKRFGH